MEFSHPYFQRDHPYLLEHIKRKISTAKTANADDKTNVKHEIVSKVLNDVKTMKGRQDSLDNRFLSMKQENEALWREVAILRQKHLKQQQIVNKLIQFLVTIVQPQRGSGIGSMGGMSGVKRRYQLMINDIPEASKVRKTTRSTTPMNKGPVIRELTEDLLESYADDDDDGDDDGGGDNDQIASPYVVSPGSFPSAYEEIENIDDVDPEHIIAENNGDTAGTTAETIDGDNVTIYNTADYNSDLIYDVNTNKTPAICQPDVGTSNRTAKSGVASSAAAIVEELLDSVTSTTATPQDQLNNFIKNEHKTKQPILLQQNHLKQINQRPKMIANAKQIPGTRSYIALSK